jgi:ACS family tartrate transporter-like MFS transporter
VRLLPFLFILYVTNYLDRASLAYAALGMSRDIGFSDRVVAMGMGVFFIGYVTFQIPGTLLVERWSARRAISASLIAWGMLTVLTSLVHTPGQLYVARFVLGVAESGFFPGVIVYLSHWFIQEDRAKATANFMAAIPFSQTIGSPVAGWVLGQMWLGLQGWRWLFVVEGMPAVLLGITAFFYLPDWPRDAAWLAPEQRHWLEETLRSEQSKSVQAVKVWQTMKSAVAIRLGVVSFFANFVTYSFVFWLPTMLKRQAHISDARVGLLCAAPYLMAFLAMQFNGWHSDRRCERRWHALSPLLIAAAGSLCVITQPHSLAISILFFTMIAVVMAFYPPIWSLPTELLSRTAAAAAVGMIAAMGNISGFAGPYVFGYLHASTGSYSYGLVAMGAAGVIGAMLILGLPRRQSEESAK